jgi:hypothetical protein
LLEKQIVQKVTIVNFDVVIVMTFQMMDDFQLSLNLMFLQEHFQYLVVYLI